MHILNCSGLLHSQGGLVRAQLAHLLDSVATPHKAEFIKGWALDRYKPA